MDGERKARVLVVVDRAAATPALLAAIGQRHERGPARFRIVVPNPAAAELHLLHPQRHEKAEEAELALLLILPAIEEVAGGRVLGSVSVRHDPMDAIEEILFSEPVDEIILSVTSHGRGRGLRQDLRHRLRHFGLPITVVQGPGQ
ncbi:MAG: hypothetical protein ACTHOK_05255 [Nocardioidaceae bacterium]